MNALRPTDMPVPYPNPGGAVKLLDVVFGNFRRSAQRHDALQIGVVWDAERPPPDMTEVPFR